MDRATRVSGLARRTEDKIAHYNGLKSRADDLEVMIELAEEDDDESMAGDIKAMLERERRTVREIAADVGISDYNYFARVFRGHMGMSPSQWRKRAQRKYAAERKAAEGTGEE